MTRQTVQVVKDDEIAPAVLRIIREAKEFVVLVSPFNAFWTHLKNEIQIAIQRKVRVTLIYQAESYARGDGTEWLLAQGGTVFRHPNLHAKIYLNESSAMLSSMNLTQGSSKNSLDIGMLVEGTDGSYKELLDYARRLANLATRIETPSVGSTSGVEQRGGPSPTHDGSFRHTLLRNSDEISKTAIKTARAWITRGRCIRCQKIIPYATDNPLCETHYAEWNRYKNPNYKENFCHKCGRQSPTTFAKPLCESCYSGSRSHSGLFRGVVADTAKQPDEAAPATERKS